MMQVEAILMAATGGTISAAIAKILVSKAFSDLEKVAHKISEISEQLLVLKEKLANLEKHDLLIITHESRISAIETKLSTMVRSFSPFYSSLRDEITL